MVKFIETYNLPKLNQKETVNLNRPITTNIIELIVKKLPRKVLDKMTLQINFTKHPKKNYHPFSNYYKKIQEEEKHLS